MCLITKALMLENTYHIYRDNGEEVELILESTSIKSSVKLTDTELKFIRNNYLYESKINHQD
jgi:hypothetical protein